MLMAVSIFLTMAAGALVWDLTHSLILVGLTGIIGGISFARTHRI